MSASVSIYITRDGDRDRQISIAEARELWEQLDPLFRPPQEVPVLSPGLDNGIRCHYGR